MTLSAPNSQETAIATPGIRTIPRAMLALAIAGILLRFAVFLVASPFNPDTHIEVIQYIAENGSLPPSNVLMQSYHPPLYYIPMAVLWRLSESVSLIHFTSFALSCTNLILIGVGIHHYRVIRNTHVALTAFALVCFLPQFVMFGNFISNDSLALLVGTAIFLASVAYIDRPNNRRLLLLAVSVATGLLTKGTFILTGPALALLIAAIESRRGIRQLAKRLAFFCILFSILGCYKYAENIANYGHPIVHNLDLGIDPKIMGSGVWKGPQTIYDINVLKLIARPILKLNDTFSYPLLMYGTFWYPHIPDSSFRASVTGYTWVGSLIYTTAIIPTLVFLYGVWRSIIFGVRKLRDRDESPECRDRRIALASLLLLFSNLTVVLAAGIKYNVWTCFQSRLCFQSILPALLIFGIGLEPALKNRWLRPVVTAACFATLACCVLYFGIEIAFARGLLPAGQELQP